MRRILLTALVLVGAAALFVLTGGASNGSSNAEGTYTIQLDNAFGLVTGADFKVAGVRAGTIKSIDLDQKSLHALVKVQVTQPGFGQFHQDASCQSRPQSLIGEYFVECEPGNNGGVLKPGSTISVSHTQSTIAPDLLNDIMRMPYRQRFSLIINELGAGVAGRSGDLQAALRRAVPALTETDNLLKLLADDSHTLQQLTANSDSVVTALANNSSQVQRFVVEANNAATDTAAQQSNFQATWHKLPAFLEQLRPTLKQLGQAADANTPVLNNLNAASGDLARFLTDVSNCPGGGGGSHCGFATSSRIGLSSLGKASVTGTQAAHAAGPTVRHLNEFAGSTGCQTKRISSCLPELGQNLAIVLHDLDDRGRAVEADARSPGGKGYTGIEALLQYVFNQTLAINTFTPFGHQLTVDAFIDPICAPYATPGSLAASLKMNGAAARRCYAFLGPNQPGITTQDPSNPSAPCPDPGGSPPAAAGANFYGASNPGCSKLAAPDTNSTAHAKKASASSSSVNPSNTSPLSIALAGTGGKAKAPSVNLRQTVSQLLNLLGGGSTPAASNALANAGSSVPAPSTPQGSSNQAQQLLNYLLAP